MGFAALYAIHFFTLYVYNKIHNTPHICIAEVLYVYGLMKKPLDYRKGFSTLCTVLILIYTFFPMLNNKCIFCFQ